MMRLKLQAERSPQPASRFPVCEDEKEQEAKLKSKTTEHPKHTHHSQSSKQLEQGRFAQP